MFTPNPIAVISEADRLRKQRGGGTRTLEDACLDANKIKWEKPEGSNHHIFWQAVYDYLNSQRNRH